MIIKPNEKFRVYDKIAHRSYDIPFNNIKALRANEDNYYATWRVFLKDSNRPVYVNEKSFNKIWERFSDVANIEYISEIKFA